MGGKGYSRFEECKQKLQISLNPYEIHIRERRIVSSSRTRIPTNCRESPISSVWVKTHLTTVTLLPQIGRIRRAKYNANPSRFPENSTDPWGSPIPRELVDLPSLKMSGPTKPNAPPNPPRSTHTGFPQRSHSACFATCVNFTSKLASNRLALGRSAPGESVEDEYAAGSNASAAR